MKTISIGYGEFNASEISLGCMRMADLSVKSARKLIETALQNGIDFFDHADVYGGGESERIFAEAIEMKPSVREKILLQSKCGIREGCFDFSRDHILTAVDGILDRLQTDYLDVLLLHRPDALVEPDEVAEAFSRLHSSGKVRQFGVSNQNPTQIKLLSRYLGQRIIVNQLQLSLTNTSMIDAGLNVNMTLDASVDRDGSILDYCRLNDITIQAWSPLQFGFFEGVFLGNPKFPELNETIDRLAAQYEVPPIAITIAWILRHPANIQPIVGTMNPERLTAICRASEVELTRQEWYALYLSAGNKLP